MAIHHLDVSIISRGKGHSVIAAAAYRAGLRLIDERTGEVHDYTRRSGVDGAPILAPAGAEPWTQDRSTLWNAAEKAERRRDAQLARSWVLALPRELDPATNKRLGREVFERHLVSRGMVVDLYFHSLDGENPHAHALSAMRPLDGAGFAPRKNRDWDDKQLVAECREGSAAVINRYLAEAGIGRDEWVSHRSLRAQLTAALAECDYERALKLCRLPTGHLGKAATAILARGETSTRAQCLEREAEANAGRVAGMRLEVELHPEQVAQLRQEVGELDARLDQAWHAAAENKERERITRREVVESTEEGRELLRRKLRELDPKWQDRTAPRIADLDAALTHAEKELERLEAERLAAEARARQARIEAVKSKEGGQGLFEAKLSELAPGRGVSEADVGLVDEALAYAETELDRIEAERLAAAERRLAAEARARQARIEVVKSKEGGQGLFEAKLSELAPGRGVSEADVGLVDEALAYAETELDRIEAERLAAAERRLAAEARARQARIEVVKSKEGGQGLFEAKLSELAPGRGVSEADVGLVDEALAYAETELDRIEAEHLAAEERRLAEEARQRTVRLEEIRKTSEGWNLYSQKLAELALEWRETSEALAAQVDAALTYAEEKLEEDAKRRAGRVDALFDVPGCDAALFLALGAQTPNWRQATTSRDIDRALDSAEESPARWASVVEHELVLNAERTFPGASSLEWRATGDAFRGGDATDNRARAVSGLLSDRARVRVIVVREPNPAPRSLVGRLVTWLRKQVAKLLQTLHLVRRAADAVEAGVRKTRPQPHSRPDYWVPAVADEALESPPGADAFAKAVYGEVRDRYDRHVVAEDRDARFGPSDREASEQGYLAPLVDGRYERQRRSWSPWSSSPAPTRESAAAVVVEAHRSRVAEQFEIACCRATGRIEDAERLERRREQIEGAADAVEAGVRKTQSRPDYWVPAVADEALESPPGADAFAKAVYGEVRDRYDRHAVAEDRDARFGPSDREASEQGYLAPLVDGRYERQRRSWSPWSSSPAPTRESAAAVVVEAHRSRVAEQFEIACCRATGRIEDAERLERRREQIEGAADAVEAGVRKTQSRPDYWVPAVADEALESPPGADAFAKAVYGEVRDRYDRHAVAEDRDARFGPSDREASEQGYLAPLVDGRYERQRRSWSPWSSSPAPTRESAAAVVVEAHRSRVAELFEIACCRATGRIEDAERLERRREQIEGAADAVEAGVRKTQSRPDYWVPAVADEALESPPGADAFAKAVYGEVRDRYDRHAVAEDRDARFGPSDREASEQGYLAPLVDGRYERQRRSWSPWSSSPAPTRESAAAVVVEAHRSRVAELFEIACCRATGRIEDAERLERRREQIEGAADAVEAGVRKTQSRPDYWVPAVADEALESPPGADAFAKAVYGEVRDRYDRHAVAEDRDARFGPSDREASEQGYLAPLVDGRYERQRRSWSPWSSSPAPTRESAAAVVVEAHRSRVAEQFEIACCRATGRIEDAERLERRREQIEGAADAVEAGVRKTQSRPDYWVPAVADETLESPPGADAFAKAVYGEVRDRYDRHAVAEDRDARFGPSDREASEQGYLAPLVDGRYERQRRSWSPWSSSPAPTRESGSGRGGR